MTFCCGFCDTPLDHTVVDLGMGPLVSRYLKDEHLFQMEPFYPLHVFVCPSCYLVQLPEVVAPQELFGEYPYFSSVSSSWLKHARNYVDRAVDRFGLGTETKVYEIASNDGYLLQYFKEKNVQVLGIEPAQNVAKVAVEKGIPTVVRFFGSQTARDVRSEHGPANVLIGNNVLAHVPDRNDFIGGLKLLLAEGGIVTMEFPHLLRMMIGNEFDTIFHEHFSYLSLITVQTMFRKHGLEIFDVEELPTHGGSVRIYARHAEDESKPVGTAVDELVKRERAFGLEDLATYTAFGVRVADTKRKLLDLLIQIKRDGGSIVGYGAAGKAATLLTYCGIGTDFLDYIVDRSPTKQGFYMPGVHVPIYPPEKILETRPNYVLILPWNLKDEIVEQMSYIRSWGGQFVVPIPTAGIL